MSKYNEQTKQHIYAWRQTHREQYNKYINDKVKEYYDAHKKEILDKKRNMYAYKKEILRLSFLELF